MKNFVFTSVIFCGLVLGQPLLAMAWQNATVKGKVVFDENRMESWDQQKLVVPFDELETNLFERVELPPVPFPEQWASMKPEQRQAWVKEFEASDEGKKLFQKRSELIENGKSFEVKIESDGDFVVYDVPPGVYGLRGRVDKEIGDTKFAFEVFGQIEILKEVDEVVLNPLQVDVTPLLARDQVAPPVAVKSADGQQTLTLDEFKDRYVFINFWISNSPSASYQEQIQKMYVDLKDQHPLQLLSICVDNDRTAAAEFIAANGLVEGSHGFSEGLEHRTLFDYGVRAIPSFWLIAPDGKISMTQFEIATALRANQELKDIVANRILGKDTPTPAGQPDNAKAASSGGEAEK